MYETIHSDEDADDEFKVNETIKGVSNCAG